MNIGKRIKAKREELNMSQDELAHKLGYKSRSTINKIETGINDISQSKVVDFANALNTTVRYLMGWDTSEDSSISLTTDEQKLIDNYRSLNEEGQQIVFNLVDGIVKTENYKKSAPDELVRKKA